MGVGFMRARAAPGVIINTSSTAAFGPLAKDPAYAASKRGILAYSESCKPLHEAHGIRVVPLCPAITDTPIVAKDAAWLKPILQQIRILEPKEIAEEVRRIIEDDSLSGDPVVVRNEQMAQ
jgi:NAD(P)-dependent dehydrogenase (short-subunit alcohol dehydrogenase family)